MKMNEITREANQMLINKAYEHINRTGVPSIDNNERCCYSGTGCAFTPALTPEALLNPPKASALQLIADQPDLLQGWAQDLSPALAQNVQAAHDIPALEVVRGGRDSNEFLSAFNQRLERLCRQEGYQFPGENHEE